MKNIIELSLLRKSKLEVVLCVRNAAIVASLFCLSYEEAEVGEIG